MSFYSEIYNEAVDYAQGRGELDTASGVVLYLDRMTHPEAGCIFWLGHHVMRRLDRVMLEAICGLLGLRFSCEATRLCVSTLRDGIVDHFFDIQRGAK